MNVRNFLSNGNKKVYIFLGLSLIALIGIPFAVNTLQKPQENRSRASAATSLYFAPNSTAAAPITKNVGDPIALDVYIDPGTNLPSVVRLDIAFDATKMQPTANPFTPNTTAFPTTIEGPIVTNGHVLIALSIGSDSTKAVQSVTKVGTVYFTATYETPVPTAVSFGTQSQILSVGETDESAENVLSTTTPAYINIANLAYASPTLAYAPTNTPIPTATPYPTATPSPTPSPTVYYAPTATPVPTYEPTPIPTYTPMPTPTVVPYATTLSFDVLIHGIGVSGDNANPSANKFSNKTPLHPSRTLDVGVYDTNNVLKASGTGTLLFDSAKGSFVGTVSVGTTLTEGIYTVKIKEPTHLRRLLPGIITIKPQTNNVMPKTELVAGDINNDNAINVVDYNLLIGCYSDLLPAASCIEATKVIADLNDDGDVNQLDYNFFLREIIVQAGN